MPKLIYDPDSLRLLDVNHAAARMYGYTREEMLGLTVMDLRPPERVDEVRGIVTSKGPPRRNFAVHKTRDGTVLDVNVYSQLIDYGSGVARMATIMHAVAREKAMQEDGLLLDLVLRKLPAAVWTADADLRITRAEGSSDGGTDAPFGRNIRLAYWALPALADSFIPNSSSLRRL